MEVQLSGGSADTALAVGGCTASGARISVFVRRDDDPAQYFSDSTGIA